MPNQAPQDTSLRPDPERRRSQNRGSEMKYRIIIALGFTLACAAQAETADEFTLIQGIRMEDGTLAPIVTSIKNIEATPAWDGLGEPPLSISSGNWGVIGVRSEESTNH